MCIIVLKVITRCEQPCRRILLRSMLYEMKIIFKIEPDSVVTSSHVPSIHLQSVKKVYLFQKVICIILMYQSKTLYFLRLNAISL